MLKKDTQGSIEDNDGKFTTNFVYNAKKNHDEFFLIHLDNKLVPFKRMTLFFKTHNITVLAKEAKRLPGFSFFHSIERT